MKQIEELQEFDDTPDMAYRTLAPSGLRVSVIGFGTWAVGGIKWGETDPEEALEVMHHALDRGINLFDTAPVYGRGRSETLLGKVAEERRDELVIATKAGLRIRRDGSFCCDTRPEALQEDLDRSRTRLQSDTIDLLQVHWPPEEGLSSAALSKLDDMRNSGMVRALGVCHFPLRKLRSVQDMLPLDTVQLRFNMLQTDLFEEERSFCRNQDLPILSCTSLGKGLLTGKYEQRPHFPELDNRHGDPLFDPDQFPLHLEHLEQVLEVAEDVEKPASAVTLNWTHQQSGITSALAGMKTREQVDQNVQAVDWELSEEQMNTLTSGQ